jgi:hypothetical protein
MLCVKRMILLLLLAMFGVFTVYLAHGQGCENSIFDGFRALGFDSSDVDSIKIVRFEKRSDFKKPLDSFYVHAVFRTYKNTQLIYFRHQVRSSSDWEIIFKNNLVYKVSDIECRDLHQHGQVILRCAIFSYELNGELKTRDACRMIEVRKPGYLPYYMRQK